jgi:hypothetical protein
VVTGAIQYLLWRDRKKEAQLALIENRSDDAEDAEQTEHQDEKVVAVEQAKTVA